MKWLSGSLLVASRRLRDPNFSRTVVLILEHTHDGALGVILNRSSKRTIREVWEAIDAEPVDRAETLFEGGPVPGPVIALHTSEELNEKTILPGLFMCMKRELVDELVRRPEARFRLYSNNSGWGGGQLEDELKAGGWLTAPAKLEDVFADDAKLWDDVTRRIGLGIMLPGTSADQLPDDPSVN